MNPITLRPSKIRGQIEAPPSKSYTHRAIIAAALAEGTSTIKNPLVSDDTIATVECCKKLGAKITKEGKNLKIEGTGGRLKNPGTIGVRNSGTTLRIMLGLCSLVEGKITLTTNHPESLGKRTNTDLIEALEKLGIKTESDEGRLPITVHGTKPATREVQISGKKSSQYISSLMFLAPLTPQGLKIKIIDEIKSKPYLKITLDVLEKTGVNVKSSKDLKNLEISPQKYKAFDYEVPGDYSNAAILLCLAAATGSGLRINNLYDDQQGDKKILEILEKMGIQIIRGTSWVEIEPAEKILGIEYDGKNTPDIIPPLAALAAFANKPSRFYNIAHLRIKESDRIGDLAKELGKLGVKTRQKEDELAVLGHKKLRFAEINPHDDHRLAMSLSIIGLAGQGVRIQTPEVVAKSYPGFFKDIEKIGARVQRK